MTVTLIKTKAEQALIGEFAAKAKVLPGDGAARTHAMAAFEQAGLPHRRIESWKYTDLRNVLKDAHPIAAGKDTTAVSQSDLNAALGPLATLEADRLILVNGSYRADLSSVPSGVSVQTLSTSGLKSLAASPGTEAVISLNRALVTDGVAISIANEAVRNRPLMIVHAVAGSKAQFVSVRHTLEVGAAAKIEVIEARVTLAGAAAGQMNGVTEVSVAAGAELRHVQLGLEGAAATSLVSTVANLGADAVYKLFQVTAGTGLARNQTFVTFTGEGGKLDISGLMLGRGRQHCDTTLVIDHAVPACESRELFKAVLDGEARAVFQGKVIVRQDAQKTDGKQMANALMLSETAEFDSKPELEIYADDVVCGHGATVAEIDPKLMFYLRSRGIPLKEARAMLIESFAGDVLEKVEDEALREALADVARAWFAQSATTSA